tara:strand:+ start:153 stop:563 length:411 start_codon:yes stop_codon:yes gene_type:complete
MNLNSKKIFNLKIIARYSETDSMSYVHHSNYLKYYEIGRLGWFKNIGFSYKRLEDEGVILPVIRTNITFRRPAFFDDELDLQTTLIKEPSYSIEFDYKIFKKKELINEGYTKLVFLNKKTSKPIRCPKKIIEAIIN